MSNMDVNIRWIDNISLVKQCEHSEGRASFRLDFETEFHEGPLPKEEYSLSLTANASAVAKFERIAAAINAIMDEPDAAPVALPEAEFIAAAINEIMDDKDGWLDMSTAPEDGTEILACIRQHNRPDGKIVQAVVWFENGDWRLDDDEKGRAHPPLCWRRLPAPRASDAAPVALPDAAE